MTKTKTAKDNKTSGSEDDAYGWTCMRRLPPGGLVLVPAIEPQRRDAFLATAVANGRIKHCLWVCATEAVASVRQRLQAARAHHLIEVCKKEADKDEPSIKQVPFPMMSSRNEQGADEQQQAKAWTAYRRYEAESKERQRRIDQRAASMAKKYAADWISQADWLQCSALPPPAGIAGIEELALRENYSLIVVDDASHVSTSGNKPASSKQTGEIVRRLKAVAMERETRLLVGMPAPCRVVKDRNTGAEHEAHVELADLASYGNPHEAADVVVEAETLDVCEVIFNRYGPLADADE